MEMNKLVLDHIRHGKKEYTKYENELMERICKVESFIAGVSDILDDFKMDTMQKAKAVMLLEYVQDDLKKAHLELVNHIRKHHLNGLLELMNCTISTPME